MLDLSSIVIDPDFAQSYTVYRESGTFTGGRWVAAPELVLTMTGVVSVAKPQELVQVPEADRTSAVMAFYSAQPIYTTRSDSSKAAEGTSDQILWNGDRYRVSTVAPWKDFGYYKALAVRMSV
jgi:hypothetical protein